MKAVVVGFPNIPLFITDIDKRWSQIVIRLLCDPDSNYGSYRLPIQIMFEHNVD